VGSYVVGMVLLNIMLLFSSFLCFSSLQIRFINFERTKLPEEILKHNLEEKRKYYAEISLEMEKTDAEIQVSQ